MGKLLYPDEFINSIFDITYEYLNSRGLFYLIMDIDNTLSKWGSKKPDINACDWIGNMREKGFKICILSNSSNNRISNYCSNMDVMFVKNGIKPFKASFLKAMRLMGSNNENTCVIGDQLLTDILGGNLCGIFTILVSPIDNNEFVLTRFSRMLQKAILNKYYKKRI
jgi:uncharacterized protein